MFAYGTAPGEVADPALPGRFRDLAGFEIAAEGEQPLLTAEFAAHGEPVEAPLEMAGGGACAVTFGGLDH